MFSRFICILFPALFLNPLSPRAAEDFAIRLSHPEKPGSRMETDTTADTDDVVTFSVRGRVFRENKNQESWRLRAMETIDAITDQSEASRKTLKVIEFTQSSDGVTKPVLKPGAIIKAASDKGEETFTVDGSPAAPQVRKMLERLVSLSEDGRPTDDDLYGTSKRKKIGERWPIDSKAIARAMKTAKLSVAPDAVSGQATLKAVREKNGRRFLEIETTVATRDMEVEFIPTFKVVKAESNTTFSGLFPADDKGGRIQDAMDTTFVVVGKGRRSPEEPEVTAEARTHVKLSRTIKYLE